MGASSEDIDSESTSSSSRSAKWNVCESEDTSEITTLTRKNAADRLQNYCQYQVGEKGLKE